MALDPSIIERKEFVVGTDKYGIEHTISVRALSAMDLAGLFDLDGGALAYIFNSGEFDWSSGEAVVSQLIYRMSELMSYVIAAAADEFSKESAETISRLNVAKQVEILEAIYRLTLPEGEESKKKMLEGIAVILSSSGYKS